MHSEPITQLVHAARKAVIEAQNIAAQVPELLGTVKRSQILSSLKMTEAALEANIQQLRTELASAYVCLKACRFPSEEHNGLYSAIAALIFCLEDLELETARAGYPEPPIGGSLGTVLLANRDVYKEELANIIARLDELDVDVRKLTAARSNLDTITETEKEILSYVGDEFETRSNAAHQLLDQQRINVGGVARIMHSIAVLSRTFYHTVQPSYSRASAFTKSASKALVRLSIRALSATQQFMKSLDINRRLATGDRSQARAGSQQKLKTCILLDYDNIYLMLRRDSHDASRRFAKDCGVWLRAIVDGVLIDGDNDKVKYSRTINVLRCYGNPVPRRNPDDNSTDMNSFPFVRHHFLRQGFEVVDCPPLTAQLKNASDIRMVLDVNTIIQRENRIDEFIFLTVDADFTPVLQMLRAADRRCVVYSTEYTAAPYLAIANGEIRHSRMLGLLLGESRV